MAWSPQLLTRAGVTETTALATPEPVLSAHWNRPRPLRTAEPAFVSTGSQPMPDSAGCFFIFAHWPVVTSLCPIRPWLSKEKEDIWLTPKATAMPSLGWPWQHLELLLPPRWDCPSSRVFEEGVRLLAVGVISLYGCRLDSGMFHGKELFNQRREKKHLKETLSPFDMKMFGLGSVKKPSWKMVSSCRHPAVQVPRLCTCALWTCSPWCLFLVFYFPRERERFCVTVISLGLIGTCFPFLKCFKNSCRLSYKELTMLPLVTWTTNSGLFWTQWKVRGSEEGGCKLYFLCEHLTNLWNRMKEEMLNCLLFYYIYMENLTLPLVSTKRVVSLTHDCLSLVSPCVLCQPVVTDGNDWIVIVWRPGGKVNLHCTIWS